MGKDSPDPPAPPDYRGAAQAESAGSAQAAIGSNVMGHPNIYTPLGSQTWEQSGNYSVPGIGGNPGFNIPTWTQNVNLSPEGQGLFDEQMNLSQGLLGLGNTSLGQVQDSLGEPMDLSSIQNIADQSYNMQTRRLDPQWEQREGMERTRLANQGLVAGGEAYDDAMRGFNEGRNDAYERARLSSISTMPQTYQMEAASRMQPLTEFNAIRTGAQPQMPQFQPVQYAGMQGPNLLQAAGMEGNYNQNLYGQQLGSQNSFMSGLFDLGAAAMPLFI